jgi:thiol-disulfide isomerase/thioredoxin
MKKILYITATWCQPCIQLKPKIQAMQNKFPITILDADTNAAAIRKYAIRNIPTILIINGDLEIARLVGNNITEQKIIDLYNK